MTDVTYSRRPSVPASFQYRGNLFQRLKTVTLTPEALKIRRGSRSETAIPFARIAKIDLLQHASPAYGTAYECRLWHAGGLFPVLVIGSKSFRGFNDFETKDTAYRKFVTQLHAAIREADHKCRFEVTVPESTVLLSLLSSAHLALPALMIAFISVLLLSGGDIPAAVIGTVVAALSYAGFALSRLKRWGPWPYDPSIIPEAMLPKQGGELFAD